jgi:spoIIIJ-associated protein
MGKAGTDCHRPGRRRSPPAGRGIAHEEGNVEVDGVEFSGRTVEDAIRQAEAELGERRGALSIEVITAGRSGVFGIGAEPARIRVRRPAPEPEPPAPEREREAFVPNLAEETPIDRVVAQESGDFESEPSATHPISANGADLPDEAADVLRNLLATMGFDAEVTVRSNEDPVMLGITGHNLGVLIGRRGDNLSALQFMVNLILSKNRRQWPRVVIDVENYRARREESLRSLADRTAYRVRRSGRPFTLDAMPAGDRRVIHLSLRDESDIETYSIGEGIARRVVIAPKGAAARAPGRPYR